MKPSNFDEYVEQSHAINATLRTLTTCILHISGAFALACFGWWLL